METKSYSKAKASLVLTNNTGFSRIELFIFVVIVIIVARIVFRPVSFVTKILLSQFLAPVLLQTITLGIGVILALVLVIGFFFYMDKLADVKK